MFNLKFRIGAKLGITSALGILLVAAMVIVQQMSGAAIDAAAKMQLRQQDIAQHVSDSKAAIRGMQVGVRDLRLAKSPEQVKTAMEYLNARHTSVLRFVDDALSAVTRPENRARLTRVRSLAEDYFGVANEIVKASDERKEELMRERGAPIAAAVDKEIEELLASVKTLATSAAEGSEATIIQSGRIALGLGLLVVLVLISSAIFGAVTIAKPIGRIAHVLLTLASGNKAVEIPYTARGDEIGDAARAANTFRDNLVQMEKMKAEQREAEVRAMLKLADEFEATVGGIVETVSSASTELEAAAGTLTKTAENTQKLSTVVAAASEEASSNVQSVASATEELTSSVSEIGRQVQESSKIASEAVRQAQQTDVRINELSAAASRIGDVVKLITSVAEQTNLLALNATIEAARAGEAGRGFAVVAQEVKALAAQTAKATEEIGSQVGSMQTATQESVAAIKAIGGTIGKISDIASTIAAAVEEQGAATREISRNIGEAAKGTAQVATNITDVNRGAGETGSASTQVLSSAKSLSNESNRLKAEVGKFLSTVRAA